MRWDALFEDIEGQYAASVLASTESEVSERVRMEQAGIGLGDRLRGQLRRSLKIRVAGGSHFEGEVAYVGSEWLVLQAGMRSVLLPFAALQLIEGMGRFSAQEASPGRQRLGIASAFRGLARDRASVAIYLRDSDRTSVLTGTIDRVGCDFLEIAVGRSAEFHSAESVSGVYAVAFTALAAVSSQN